MISPLLRRYTWNSAWLYNVRIFIALCGTTLFPWWIGEVKLTIPLTLGVVAAAPFLGAVAGNIVGGWLSDRVFRKRRKPTMILSTVSTVVMMYALVHAPNDPAMLAVLLFLTGLLLSFGSLLIILYIAYAWLSGRSIPGWTSLMLVVVVLGAVQMFVLGMIGEYLGRLYVESKRQPLYLVADIAGPVQGRATLGFNGEEHKSAPTQAPAFVPSDIEGRDTLDAVSRLRSTRTESGSAAR